MDTKTRPAQRDTDTGGRGICHAGKTWKDIVDAYEEGRQAEARCGAMFWPTLRSEHSTNCNVCHVCEELSPQPHNAYL